MSIARGGGARRSSLGGIVVLGAALSPSATAQWDEFGEVASFRSAVLEREDDSEERSPALAAEAPRSPAPGELVFLPKGDVFRPLLADPRQVRSHTTLTRLRADFGDYWIGVAGLGETFGIVTRRDEHGDGWQLSIAAAVRSFFNFDGFDNDLINTDFIVGLPFSWKREQWSLRANLLHQSSHISDEFFRFEAFGPTDAVPTQKLSFEAFDLVVGYEPLEALRVYAGANRIFSADNDIRRWSYRVGADWEGPRLSERIRPVAGFDVRWWAETSYKMERSVKAGLQLEGTGRVSKLSLLLEYYRGPYHQGFFYVHEVESVGIGLLFQF